jgi:branched-chain amino acid aminotransferase
MIECIGKYYSEGISFKDIAYFDEAVFNTGVSFYEVMRVFDGVCLFFEEHVSRLKESMRLSGCRFTPDSALIRNIIPDLLSRNKLKSGNIKLVVHVGDSNSPIIFTYIIPHVYPSRAMYIKGVNTAVYKIVRKDPNVKRISPEIRKQLSGFIIEKKIFEALLVDENAFITEGSKSNVFFIKSNTVYTAPDETVLKGITRDKILKLCKHLNYNVIEKSVSINNLNTMEASFITGTSPGVLPIRKINRLLFAVDNLLLNALRKEYNTLIRLYIEMHRGNSY